SLLLLDARDLQTGEVLAVPLTLLVPRLVLVLLDHNLGAAELARDFGADRDLRQCLGIGRDRLTVDKKHGIEFDAVSSLRLHSVDCDDVADAHLFLVASGADDGIDHGRTLFLHSLDRTAVVPWLPTKSPSLAAHGEESPAVVRHAHRRSILVSSAWDRQTRRADAHCPALGCETSLSSSREADELSPPGPRRCARDGGSPRRR